MFPNLHAVVIVGTLIVPLIVIAFNQNRQLHSIRRVLGFIVAITAMGVMCSLLLMPGIPIAEWLFPLVGVTLVGLFVKSQRVSRSLCWGLLLVAVGLCVNSLALRDYGFTSTPPSLYELLDQTRLEILGKELRQAYPPDHVLPPGPLHMILPQLGKETWDHKTLRPLWHTLLTRLYEVSTTPSVVWYPGGPISSGSEKLQWKPIVGE